MGTHLRLSIHYLRGVPVSEDIDHETLTEIQTMLAESQKLLQSEQTQVEKQHNRYIYALGLLSVLCFVLVRC